MDSKCESGERDKLEGYDFWKQTLNSARFVVAPMVEHSELAWRMLSRKYGANLCYTPMFHAGLFASSEHYRKESLQTCAEDRPLIVQFCANNPDILVEAAKLAAPYCDAVDLNLGCPQSIAKRGHYGAFLENEWQQLRDMISKCNRELSVPITCKIRVFDDIGKTVEYANMLVRAGCQLLTIHGRTKEQKGMTTGLASWKHIKAVKHSINIPVFANGNIQYLSDVQRCIAETGVDGVMTAEGNLHNPAIFTGDILPTWQLAEEYLQLVHQYPCSMSIIRGHLFKLFHHSLQIHVSLRNRLATASEMEDFIKITADVKKQLLLDEASCTQPSAKLAHPHWLCQPYMRPAAADEGGVKDEEVVRKREQIKRQLEELSHNSIYNHLSKKKLRKLLRNPRKPFPPAGGCATTPAPRSVPAATNNTPKYVYCANCANPRAANCSYKLCKPCCKLRAAQEHSRTATVCKAANHYSRKAAAPIAAVSGQTSRTESA